MDLSILSTTDVHGYLHKGLNQVVALKEENQIDLLIDNGDFLVGSAFATYSRLHYEISPLVTIANEIGYDLMIAGNHDLDYGLPWLQKQVKHLKADYLCANLVDQEGELLFKPYSLVEKQGKTIAVFGLMTYALSQLIPEEYVHQVQVLSPFEALKTYLKKIEADLIVVAYHGGLTNDPVTGKGWHYPSLEDQAFQLMTEFPQIDALICGHQHFVNAGVNEETGAALVQPGAFGEYAGFQQFTKGKIARNKILKLEAQKYPTPWENAYQSWLNQAVNLESLKNYIKNLFPVADLYLLNYQAKTVGELAKELSHPFPISEYFVTGKKLLERKPALTIDIKADNIYQVVASPGEFSPGWLRKSYLINLFDSYMVNEAGKS